LDLKASPGQEMRRAEVVAEGAAGYIG